MATSPTAAAAPTEAEGDNEALFLNSSLHYQDIRYYYGGLPLVRPRLSCATTWASPLTARLWCSYGHAHCGLRDLVNMNSRGAPAYMKLTPRVQGAWGAHVSWRYGGNSLATARNWMNGAFSKAAGQLVSLGKIEIRDFGVITTTCQIVRWRTRLVVLATAKGYFLQLLAIGGKTKRLRFAHMLPAVACNFDLKLGAVLPRLGRAVDAYSPSRKSPSRPRPRPRSRPSSPAPKPRTRS